MVEWSITTVLKTVVPRGTGGSNPSLSARVKLKKNNLLIFQQVIFVLGLSRVSRKLVGIRGQ